MSGDPRTGGPDRLYPAYVFDLDGTVYLGDQLLPGARRAIDELRARGSVVRYLSNNPTRDPEMYAEKLGRLGVTARADEIVNTVTAMTRWLLDNAPDAVVYPISEPPLIRALEAAGIRISDDPARIDIVIASFDRTFTYEKLRIAFEAIWFHRRARLIATNPDRFCPLPGGRGEPDCAAIIAAIEASTGARCEVVTGKPDPMMLKTALLGTGVEPADSVFVGDRVSTDIRMGRDAGASTALVLTGETTWEVARTLGPEDAPTWVIDRVDRLLPPAVWAELGWASEG